MGYVVADGKSNWLEGLILIGLYVVAAVTFWFYPGMSSFYAPVINESDSLPRLQLFCRTCRLLDLDMVNATSPPPHPRSINYSNSHPNLWTVLRHLQAYNHFGLPYAP